MFYPQVSGVGVFLTQHSNRIYINNLKTYLSDSGYKGTFCSDRTFFQCSDRTCSVLTKQFFHNLETLEHFEMFRETNNEVFRLKILREVYNLEHRKL